LSILIHNSKVKPEKMASPIGEGVGFYGVTLTIQKLSDSAGKTLSKTAAI